MPEINLSPETFEIIIKEILNGRMSPERIEEILPLIDQIDKPDFKDFIKRIFDLNPDAKLRNSEAVTGILENMNQVGRWWKNSRFKSNIEKSGFRNERKLIVAEGDSWFEYPIFINDILDWLLKNDKYALYSLADGGDWIGNMIYENKYITELSKYSPEVFLISGGGNDLVGEKRIATLVKKRSEVVIRNGEIRKNEVLSISQQYGYDEKTCNRIVLGRDFLSDEFWALLNVFLFQYYILFKNIEKAGKFKNMKIITQGYDFAIPSRNRNIFKNPLRLLFGNGKWLSQPLNIKGIYDPEEQRSVIATMLYEFNEMLIYVGSKFNNIYHIDCRGLASENDWRDELHLKGKIYRKIAAKYEECIESNTTTRVFRVYP